MTCDRCLSGVTVSSPCDERAKSLSEDLELSCPDTNGNCTWFRLVGNVSTPIERRFLATDSSGNVTLLGNDNHGYGKFVVSTTSNISQCYEVCPKPTDSSKYIRSCTNNIANYEQLKL